MLLNELWTQVSGRGWISAKVEASWHVPFPVVLAKALVQAMRTATGRHPVPKLLRLLGVFQAFSLKVDPALGLVSLGADVDLVKGVADSGRLGDDLTALLQVLGETSADLGIGTLLLIDELQEAKPDELTAINMAIHQLGQGPTPLPVMLVGAGLPFTPDPARRGDQLRRAALRLPCDRPARPDLGAAGPGRSDVRAGARVARGRRRSSADPGRRLPLLPAVHRQARVGLGSQVADHPRGRRGGPSLRPRGARRRPLPHPLGARDARAAIPAAGAGHRGRRRARHMAALATATGRKRTTDLSVARNELIKKGLVYPPERGYIAFTVREWASSSSARSDPSGAGRHAEPQDHPPSGGPMPFDVEQTHRPENCPYGRAARDRSTTRGRRRRGQGVDGAFTEHVVFLLVEADDIVALHLVLAPGHRRPARRRSRRSATTPCRSRAH